MYNGSFTAVTSPVKLAKEFSVKFGLHQRSALSFFLFAIVIDMMIDDIRKASPWNMMFADDIVLCNESSENVKLIWKRQSLESRGMKICLVYGFE